MRVTLPFDLEASDAVGKAVHARSRYCWNNSFRAIMKYGHGQPVSYVEGWVVLEWGMVTDHAWLESPTGLVDPTPNYRRHARHAARGHKVPRVYFAAQRYTLVEVCAAATVVRRQPFTERTDKLLWWQTYWRAMTWHHGRESMKRLQLAPSSFTHVIEEAEEAPHLALQETT